MCVKTRLKKYDLTIEISVNHNPIQMFVFSEICIPKNGNRIICDNKATKYPTDTLTMLSKNE